MESSEPRLPSLAGCYGLLIILTGVSLVLRIPAAAFTPDRFFSALAAAVEQFRSSAHTNWIFFFVFFGVWLCCLIWAVFDIHLSGLDFDSKDARFVLWMTVSVLLISGLYGIGTHGVITPEFFPAIPIADGLGGLFLLALPGLVWLRISAKVRGAAVQEAEDARLRERSRGKLDLEDQAPGTLFVDIKECSVVPVSLLPATQAMYSRISMDHMRETMDRMTERAGTPAVSGPATAATNGLAITNEGTSRFRENLSVLNSSWDSIEKAGKDLERWFALQHQAAVAHLAMPPAARVEQNGTPESFPHETLAAVDADWAKIRQAALEIARWFGDLPPDREWS